GIGLQPGDDLGQAHFQGIDVPGGEAHGLVPGDSRRRAKVGRKWGKRCTAWRRASSQAPAAGPIVQAGLAPARSSRNPLATTMRLAPTSAKTAIHSVAWPAMASARNTALMPSAKAMFCTSARCVAHDRRTKAGILRRSS